MVFGIWFVCFGACLLFGIAFVVVVCLLILWFWLIVCFVVVWLCGLVACEYFVFCFDVCVGGLATCVFAYFGVSVFSDFRLYDS